MSDDRIAPPPTERDAMIDEANLYRDGWAAAHSRIAKLEADLATAREQIAALTESCRREPVHPSRPIA